MMADFRRSAKVHETGITRFLVHGTEGHHDLAYVIDCSREQRDQSHNKDCGSGECSTAPIVSRAAASESNWPTIVLQNGKPVLALGASGGFTIGPAIAQIFLALRAFDLPPNEALEIPRFEIPTDGHTIALEPTVPESFAHELESLGEVPAMKQSVSTPAVQLMTIRDAVKTPFADDRKHGVALSR